MVQCNNMSVKQAVIEMFQLYLVMLFNAVSRIYDINIMPRIHVAYQATCMSYRCAL